MRKVLFMMGLVVVLGLTVPAQAQLRQHVQEEQAPVRLYDAGASGFSLNRFFSPQHFRMSHSLEFNTSSWGGQTASLGMYTNTMQWQFSQKLAARVDVAFAYEPSLGGSNAFSQNNQNGRVFLRNAEIAYRPTENMTLHFSVRQNPYGYHMSPYGYGYGNAFGYQRYGMHFGNTDGLFWQDRLR